MSPLSAFFHIGLLLGAGLYVGRNIRVRRYERAGLWVAIGLMELAVYAHAVWSQS